MMTRGSFLNPVEDSVPKVDDEIAVGEDLEFQRRWWRFEKLVWTVFLIVIVCDLAGLFGRGWLAKAEASTPDRALTVSYERIERANTPSTMTLRFGLLGSVTGRCSFMSAMRSCAISARNVSRRSRRPPYPDRVASATSSR